jgi:hypothetical protein
MLVSLIAEDRAFLNLHRHRDDIRATKGVADAVVQFDVGMLLRQQIGKIRQHSHGWYVPRKPRRCQHDQQQHYLAVIEQQIAEAREKTLGITHVSSSAPHTAHRRHRR